MQTTYLSWIWNRLEGRSAPPGWSRRDEDGFQMLTEESTGQLWRRHIGHGVWELVAPKTAARARGA